MGEIYGCRHQSAKLGHVLHAQCVEHGSGGTCYWTGRHRVFTLCESGSMGGVGPGRWRSRRAPRRPCEKAPVRNADPVRVQQQPQRSGAEWLLSIIVVVDFGMEGCTPRGGCGRRNRASVGGRHQASVRVQCKRSGPLPHILTPVPRLLTPAPRPALACCSIPSCLSHSLLPARRHGQRQWHAGGPRHGQA
jgi:hypothetical protein